MTPEELLALLRLIARCNVVIEQQTAEIARLRVEVETLTAAVVPQESAAGPDLPA